MSKVLKDFFTTSNKKRSNVNLTPPEGSKNEKIRHSTSSTDAPVLGDTCIAAKVGQATSTDVTESTAVMEPETSNEQKKEKEASQLRRRGRRRDDTDRSSFYRDSISELNQLADKDNLPVSPILQADTGLESSNTTDDPEDYDGISMMEEDDDAGEGPPVEAIEIVNKMLKEDDQHHDKTEGEIKNILGIENTNQGATGGAALINDKISK